jgi:hypothetical protein
MDWLLIFIFVGLFALGYLVATLMHYDVKESIKRENEELNAQLHRLTDRDERGRFKGGK